MKLNKEKIYEEYGSLKALARKEKINESTLYSIDRKKSRAFHSNSKAFKFYKRLKELNLLKD